MRNTSSPLAAAIFAGICGLCADRAVAESNVSDAITEGNVALSFRYRYEGVDQANRIEDAGASTLLSRLNFQSGKVGGFSAFVEVDNVTQIGGGDYNSTRNGQVEFPVVADPTGTAINQAWVDFTTGSRQRFVAGRQRINFDNQRFIGSVAWRQNEQTFDALSWRYDRSETVAVQYAYLDQVNRIFGPDEGVPADEFESDSHIFNFTVQDLPLGSVTGYGYWLDFANAPGLSSQTFGLRAKGKFGLRDGVKWAYTAELATQNDYGDNPTNYSARYGLLDLAVELESYRLSAGVEILSGDANRTGAAFTTPLATLHKFQGWTDQFLNTPAAGIEDKYVKAGINVAGLNFALAYHDFHAEDGSAHYGDEWNLSVKKGFGKYGTFLFKYGQYNADQFSADADRVWGQYTFQIQ